MGSRYLDEILEQPEVLHRSAEQFPGDHPGLMEVAQTVRDGRYRRIVLTGMGSSLYSLYPLWLTLSARVPIPATMWDASELVHFAPAVLAEDTLLIVASQSGESAEIRALADIGGRPKTSVGITNGPDNSLARWADFSLQTYAGEEATVSTKTYITTLALLNLLGCLLVGDDAAVRKNELRRAASELASWLADWQSKLELMSDFLGRCETLAFVGRGPSLASVRTAALITEESSKVFCLGLSAGQFRHGPLELARPGFSAVLFAGRGPTRTLNERLAYEIGDYGGKCLMITPKPVGKEPPGVLEMAIPTADARVLPILEIVPIQLLTIALAHALGYEPATFEHASKITHFE